MRGFWIVNALLACVNIAVIVFLVFCHLNWSKATRGAREDAATLGMDVHCVNPPYAVLVDEDYPRKNKVAFFDYDEQFCVSVEDCDSHGLEAARTLLMTLGTGFSISCDYSLADGTQVRNLRLTTDDASFVDLKADGSFDSRCLGSA